MADKIAPDSMYEFDVFIAYYGNVNGTQRQAEALYKELNEYTYYCDTTLTVKKHLRVYQKTAPQYRNDPYRDTIEYAESSRMFLLIADENIPTDNLGKVPAIDKNGSLKELYRELRAFSRGRSYKQNFRKGVCAVIADGALTSEKAECLHEIFNGTIVYPYSGLVKNDFRDIKEMIVRFLAGHSTLIDEPQEVIPSRPEHQQDFEIEVGPGTASRLFKLSGTSTLPYETLFTSQTLEAGLENNTALRIDLSDDTEFIPDAEILLDCEKIIARTKEGSAPTLEERVFMQFIDDLRAGKKINNPVCRVKRIEGITTYAQPTVYLQPIRYSYIMKMSMLDTLFLDGQKETTLRRKYALQHEQDVDFQPTSRMGEHCGCGVFFITSDGYVVIQRRMEASENKVSFFPGRCGYTVSGSYLYDKRNPFEFMADKINYETRADFDYELMLRELGYEYEYLHYQFSFFAFCSETRDEFSRKILSRGAQARGYEYVSLSHEKELAHFLRNETWEKSALAVLINALRSSQFQRELIKHRNIMFNKTEFHRYFTKFHSEG